MNHRYLLAAQLLLLSCAPVEAPAEPIDDPLRDDVLRDLSTHFALGGYEAVEMDAAALQTAVEGLCADPTEETQQ